MNTKALMAVMLLAVTAAPGGALAKDKRPDTLVPKADTKPLECIHLRQIRDTKVRSDSVIDFNMLGGKVYRNTLPHSCPQLGFEERFSYKTSLSQLCSTDIITVLTTAGPGISSGASCGLGQFQEMVDTKKAAGAR